MSLTTSKLCVPYGKHNKETGHSILNDIINKKKLNIKSIYIGTKPYKHKFSKTKTGHPILKSKGGTNSNNL